MKFKEISINDLVAVIVLGIIVCMALAMGLGESSIVSLIAGGILGYIGIRNPTEQEEVIVEQELETKDGEKVPIME